MQTIAIVNEKGGTAKTTTTVNLAACLGQRGRRVLVVDLDGQAATSRWFGVEEDGRLADALVRGSGLEPIEGVSPNVDLAPACGKIDSVAHELRPTQGGQLRKLLAEVEDRYDFTLIDCPPSLGNRLIGNALLAASHAIAPVETSILALDGLRMLLTMLGDIRDGFGHDIRLMGILPCRYDARTKLSRLVLAELQRTLPEHVFRTVIRANVKLQECPAAQQSILLYAPQSSAAEDYLSLAQEVETGGPTGRLASVSAEPAAYAELDAADRATVDSFRQRAARHLGYTPREPVVAEAAPADGPADATATAGEGKADAVPVDVAALPDKAMTAHEAAPFDLGDQADEQIDLGLEPGFDGSEESAAAAGVGRWSGRKLMVSMGAVALVLVGLVGWATYQLRGGPDSASASIATRAAESMAGQAMPPTDAADEAASSMDDRADDSEAEAGAIGSAGAANAADEPARNASSDEEADTATASMTTAATGDDPGDSGTTGALDGSPPDTAFSDATDAASMLAAFREGMSDERSDATSASKPDGADGVEAGAETEPSDGASDQASDGAAGDAASTAETEAEQVDAAPARGPRSAQPLPTSLRLNGTVVRPDGGTAMINGTVLRQGERYRGATLVEVRRDSATLEYEGRTYRLVLGGPAVSVTDESEAWE